jgi:hypothetical protein
MSKEDKTVIASSPWDGSKRVFQYEGFQEGFRGGGNHLWTEQDRGSTFTGASIAKATAKAVRSRVPGRTGRR